MTTEAKNQVLRSLSRMVVDRDSLFTPPVTSYQTGFERESLPISTVGFRGTVQDELPFDDSAPLVTDYSDCDRILSERKELEPESWVEELDEQIREMNGDQLTFFDENPTDFSRCIQRCTKCGGRGEHEFVPEPCDQCAGTGEMLVFSEVEEEEEQDDRDIFAFKGEDARLYHNR